MCCLTIQLWAKLSWWYSQWWGLSFVWVRLYTFRLLFSTSWAWRNLFLNGASFLAVCLYLCTWSLSKEWKCLLQKQQDKGLKSFASIVLESSLLISIVEVDHQTSANNRWNSLNHVMVWRYTLCIILSSYYPLSVTTDSSSGCVLYWPLSDANVESIS